MDQAKFSCFLSCLPACNQLPLYKWSRQVSSSSFQSQSKLWMGWDGRMCGLCLEKGTSFKICKISHLFPIEREREWVWENETRWLENTSRFTSRLFMFSSLFKVLLNPRKMVGNARCFSLSLPLGSYSGLNILNKKDWLVFGLPEHNQRVHTFILCTVTE